MASTGTASAVAREATILLPDHRSGRTTFWRVTMADLVAASGYFRRTANAHAFTGATNVTAQWQEAVDGVYIFQPRTDEPLFERTVQNEWDAEVFGLVIWYIREGYLPPALVADVSTGRMAPSLLDLPHVAASGLEVERANEAMVYLQLYDWGRYLDIPALIEVCESTIAIPLLDVIWIAPHYIGVIELVLTVYYLDMGQLAANSTIGRMLFYILELLNFSIDTDHIMEASHTFCLDQHRHAKRKSFQLSSLTTRCGHTVGDMEFRLTVPYTCSGCRGLEGPLDAIFSFARTGVFPGDLAPPGPVLWESMRSQEDTFFSRCGSGNEI